MTSWEKDADALLASGARHFLFISRGDAARGQIAEGLARALAPRHVEISSAGMTRGRVDPLAVRVLAELSVDIADQRSKSLDEVDTSDVQAVVTLAEEATVPQRLRDVLHVHWPLPDPAAKAGSEEDRVAVYRAVRVELRRRLLRVFARVDHHAETAGMPTTSFEPAAGGDLEAIRGLLAASLLPSRDIGLRNQRFIVARQNGKIVGCAGLEVYGHDGQVRSIAVDWTRRTAGLGTRLHERLLQEAVLCDVRRLFVITATAEDFFARHGYSKVRLDEVPAEIRASEEFRMHSPASAATMSRTVPGA
jgi:N-acetylglutamate synthase-like GNAT family acetyltransferase/protein-tyrosine-phosphatase